MAFVKIEKYAKSPMARLSKYGSLSIDVAAIGVPGVWSEVDVYVDKDTAEVAFVAVEEGLLRLKLVGQQLRTSLRIAMHQLERVLPLSTVNVPTMLTVAPWDSSIPIIKLDLSMLSPIGEEVDEEDAASIAV